MNSYPKDDPPYTTSEDLPNRSGVQRNRLARGLHALLAD